MMIETVKTRDALIIFIKNSKLGQVKTRIAKDTDDAQALDIYEKLLTITLNLAKSLDCDIIVYYSDEIVADAWDHIPCIKKLQSGKDLGERMHHAFKECLSDYDKLLLIGSDCPYITTADIQLAFRSLTKSDLVLGPVMDGGYYLIGMKKLEPALFKNIAWSTDKVLNQTMEIADNLELTFGLLDTYDDIDHYKDWIEYQKGL